jgi:hypothetical protein
MHVSIKMPYAITHDGKAFGPDGLISDVEGTPLLAEHASDYNQQLEAQQLAHIKTGPDHLDMLYVKLVDTTDESYAKALADSERAESCLVSTP